jgi:hypothetical protein
MYTSYIGKKFLEHYKIVEKKADSYSACNFFDEIMFPVFFNNDKHLMHVGNSPFFQSPKSEEKIDKTELEEIDKTLQKYQKENPSITFHNFKTAIQFHNFKEKVKGEPGMSIYVGAAADISAGTSGQDTDMPQKITSEDMYLSWIGAALGIGVSGRLVLLINNEDILWKIYNGWSIYRNYLNQTKNLKDKQIETWNGNWLNHCLGFDFNDNNPMEGFNISLDQAPDNKNSGSLLAISTLNWPKIIFKLSLFYNKNKSLIAYVYNLGQTNTTIGFVTILLYEVRRPFELRDKLFIDKKNSILSDTQIESLEVFYSLKQACEAGVIGLKSLEPAKLKDYMPNGGKEFKFSNNNSSDIFSLYKLWIIAMLNKTDLLQLATQMAKSIIDLEKEATRGKTTLSQETKELLDSRSLKKFVEKLSEMLNANNALTFKDAVSELIKMPIDSFSLFITLVKFEYAVLKANPSLS